MTAAPRFSVIIPTRNRPQLLQNALRSVEAQDYPHFEIIVIDDGSAAEFEKAYRSLRETLSPGTLWDRLVYPKGHGASYVLNFGAMKAAGDFLCFLDDDDEWTDPGHLSRLARVIAADAEGVELLFACQEGYRNGEALGRGFWLEDLTGRLRRPPDCGEGYRVSLPELLSCGVHCHTNVTTIARSLFERIDGFDELIRYDCDLDFYLRAIDRARSIIFLPVFVSRHNIPEKDKRLNMSTIESELSRRVSQLRVLNKAILFSRHQEIRAYAERSKTYVLRHIAAELDRIGHPSAAFYAREALLTRPSVGGTKDWLVQQARRWHRAALRRRGALPASE